jgi:hypothetical protein
MKNSPGLSAELAEHLRQTDPNLLERVEAALNFAPQNPRFEKILNAEEESQLSDLQKQMADKDTSADQRGKLANAALKLRGLSDLFPHRTAVKN